MQMDMLYIAFDAALALRQQNSGRKASEHDLNTCIEISSDDCFRASITRETTPKIRLSTGCAQVIDALSENVNGDLDTQKCLIWLMLHELSHIDLGHFEFADRFGVAQRGSIKNERLAPVSAELRSFAPLCLELQADHEATEMLLGAYSSDGWDDLRARVMAISAMMVLIEREDVKNGAEGRTHPKAATRIFQLLGHVSEMPLIQAQLSKDVSDLPSEEQLKAFAKEVTIPCFFDAIQLAEVAGASSIVSDLGEPEEFFKDLEIVKLGDPAQYCDLKTQGAQEWTKLWECNEALKPILGGHFTN